MGGDTLVEVILAIAIVGIPAAALSLRFVLRPMLKDVTEAIRSIRQPTSPQLEQRLAELEEGQQLIGEQLKRLVEAERFRAQLHSGSESK
jgi:hypothetical protein